MANSYKENIKRIKFYGQGGIDKLLYERILTYRSGPGFFVECGAFNGVTDSTCKFLEDHFGWSGMNIEPSPYAFKLLEKNRPNSINLNCAISDKKCVSRFKNAIHPRRGSNFGNGSLSHTEAHLKALKKEGCSFEEFDVKCDRFDNIAIEYNVQNVDLFVLDVEGHEIQAINGIIPKVLPKIFCIEHTLVGLNNLKGALLQNYELRWVHKHNAVFLKNEKL